MMRHALFVMVVAGFVPGCVELGIGPWPCAENDECGPGWSCVEQVCRPASWSSPTDALQDAVVDAAVGDVGDAGDVGRDASPTDPAIDAADSSDLLWDASPDGYCDGAADQAVPECPTSCTVDGQCDGNAHCDQTCEADVPTGGACDEASDCVSGHCANGFCCTAGLCCAAASDCPGAVGPVCDNPSACSGYRVDATCQGNVCGTATVADGRSCSSTTTANECGPYLPVYCNGAAAQSAPGCPTSCTESGQCDPGAFCHGTSDVCQEAPPGLRWVSLPGGVFRMGCTYDNYCSETGGDPEHDVTAPPFQILETEVTRAQFATVMPIPDPSCRGGGDLSPVECVDWDDARWFCQAIEGRLCTEAEWEYAARAGTANNYTCGNDASCLAGAEWYDDNAGGSKHDVRGLSPNGYGLYDMGGNVREWVEDDWHSSYTGAPTDGRAWVDYPRGSSRVVRGGNTGSSYEWIFVWVRGQRDPAGQFLDVGLRCCR